MGRRPKNTDSSNYNPTQILTFLRIREGLTMAELAEKTGLTTNDVCRFERNHHNLGAGKLLNLAEFFGVKMATLWENDLISLGKYLKKPVYKSSRMRERIHKHLELCERIGDAGEDYVFELEKARLRGTPYENLINPNYANDETSHFDLLSFDINSGDPIRIEVKTTPKDQSECFYMTAGELRVLEECLQRKVRYELHRVSYINDRQCCTRTIYTPEEVLEKFDIVPDRFKLVPKEGGV